jgi:hypothetical protein
MNCGIWAHANIAGLPAGRETLDLFRPYVDRGWVECDDAGHVVSIAMPETAVALLPSLGFRVASYAGTGPAFAVGWARWSTRLYRGVPLLLVVESMMPDAGAKDTHVLVARDGALFDNNVPAGRSGADHPYAAARVLNVLRLLVAGTADPRRWNVAAVPSESPEKARTGR